MPISRSAHYLDGRTATRHGVTLTVRPRDPTHRDARRQHQTMAI
jgi:hypothetical protein